MKTERWRALDGGHDTVPIHWRNPRFVEVVPDLFAWDGKTPYEVVDRAWFTMAICQRHTFKVTTRYPKKALTYLIKRAPNNGDPTNKEGDPQQPLRNIWLGVRVSNQQDANDLIPKLLECPAALRFIECSPLLEDIDLTPQLLLQHAAVVRRVSSVEDLQKPGRPHPRIDWVIASGEIGKDARPSRPDWFRSLRDQCAAAGVPFFFTGWGEWAPNCLCGTLKPHRELPRPEPGKPGVMFGCGSRRSGRLLDGVEHNGMPEVKQ